LHEILSHDASKSQHKLNSNFYLYCPFAVTLAAENAMQVRSTSQVAREYSRDKNIQSVKLRINRFVLDLVSKLHVHQILTIVVIAHTLLRVRLHRHFFY
jgi:hypothetical protein